MTSFPCHGKNLVLEVEVIEKDFGHGRRLPGEGRDTRRGFKLKGDDHAI